jgi:hypothetical protein
MNSRFNCSSLASVPKQSAIFSVCHLKSSCLGCRHVHFLSLAVSNTTTGYEVDSRGSILSRRFHNFSLNKQKALSVCSDNAVTCIEEKPALNLMLATAHTLRCNVKMKLTL